MKIGDFIAWRYLYENDMNLTITRFGTLEDIGTVDYIIKDAKTGELQRIPQYEMVFIVGHGYNADTNKDSIETTMNKIDIKQILINNQDETGV